MRTILKQGMVLDNRHEYGHVKQYEEKQYLGVTRRYGNALPANERDFMARWIVQYSPSWKSPEKTVPTISKAYPEIFDRLIFILEDNLRAKMPEASPQR